MKAMQEESEIDWLLFEIHTAGASPSFLHVVDDGHEVVVGGGSSVTPLQGPELHRGHGNRKEPVLLINQTSNVPSASKLLSGGPSTAVDDSSPLLVASGLIDGNEKAPASKLLSGGPFVAVGDSRSHLPASGAMAKGEKAPVLPMNLNSVVPYVSASKLFSGGPSSAVASRTEAGIGRHQKWPILPPPRPSSPPSRPPSAARPAQRPVVAAGFVLDTELVNDLNGLHLGNDRRGTSGLTLLASAPTNIPINSSPAQITTPRNNLYSINYGAYWIPPNPLFNINRNPLLAQFQQQFPAQGGELRRNPQAAMFSLPGNSSARSRPDRANGAASRSKYPGIYKEPRRARTARNNSTLMRRWRPYHTLNQWIDLFTQIDLQLQAQGAAMSVLALFQRHGGRPADVKDAMYCIARNKHACLVLQDKLREGLHMVEMILDGVLDHALELMADGSGNYLMQKLMELCTQEQLMEIFLAVNRCEGALVGVSLSAHGTMSVQALIKNLVNKQLITWVIAALQPGLLCLFKDPNGNDVVQTCLAYLTPDENKFIFKAAKENFVDLSTHKQGCVMIQQCINYAAGGMYERALLIDVAANGYELSRNQYGNYVVQCALKRNNPVVIANIAFHLRGKYVQLSKDKYGSNVVEKCLHKFSEKDQNVIIVELLLHPFGLLMQDPFANYVVQTACKCYEGPFWGALEAAIVSHQGLASSPYCKGIFSKLKAKREDYFLPDSEIYRVQ